MEASSERCSRHAGFGGETHDGDLMGIAPTGATIELPMAIVSRVDGGRIVEEWEYFDSATIMSQLGV